MDNYMLGAGAAIATAILWSGNSILFSAAGKRIGALSVNAFRVVVALVLLGIVHTILFGTIVPAANKAQWFWMAVSGVIGIGIGDLALFSAFITIGPRRSLLLMSLAPVFSAVFGYLILREILGVWAIIGIAVTLAGIIIVILEEEEVGEEILTEVSRSYTGGKNHLKEKKIYGSIMGAIGALGQGIALVLAKYGMFTVADDPKAPLPSLPATLIRMIAGTIFIWMTILIIGKLPSLLKQGANDPFALFLTSCGGFIGPFLGIWLSLVSVTYIQVGIAQTLMSLMPVLIIPMVWITHKEKTGWRGITGAIVAVVGVGILFLF